MPEPHEIPLDIDLDFDMEGVVPMGSNQRLRPGKYKCQITACAPYRYKNKDTKGYQLIAEFVDMHSGDTIQCSFNVVHPSEKARDVAKRQWATLLKYGGHPTPEAPGKRAYEDMVGNMIGVHVVEDKYISDRDGQERIGSQVSSWTPFFDPNDDKVPLGPEAEAAPAAAPAKANGEATDGQADLDYDDIPF